MINANNVPDVSSNELLARYIGQKNHFRADKTVKGDAFVPHPHNMLSVTRHLHATMAELWAVGKDIVHKQDKTFYGMANIKVSDCESVSLKVIKDPLPENPNHANITDFPTPKEEQKLIAQKLARLVSFYKL